MGINNKKLTTEEFITRAKEVHGDRYDYSKVEYINSHTNVCIICSEHGEFWQKPLVHINQKCNCKKCRGKNLSLNEWIIRMNKIHNNKYDYSKTIINSRHETTIIICPIHGEFKQKVKYHALGLGCIKCGIEHVSNTIKLTQKEFIERSKSIHGDKYGYSEVNYINGYNEKVNIICPIHGIFKQLPSAHMQGHGCPSCKNSTIESQLTNILKEKHITFLCRFIEFDWLKNKRKMELDFYLPDYNVAIECQGKQHFSDKIWFGCRDKEKIKKNFKNIQHRDNLKKQLCEQNGVKLFYINYDDNIVEKTNYILETILKNN